MSNNNNNNNSSNVKKFYETRLCLHNVAIAMTKPEVLLTFVQDFPSVEIYMPENTHNKKTKTKLVFLDFPQPWQARLACRLINLMVHGKIAATFAENKEIGYEEMAPPKLQKRSVYPEGEVPENGICAFCKRNAYLVCESCFTTFCCTFYCNEDHQLRDWSEHKYDCKKPKKLILATDAVSGAEKKKGKLILPYVDTFNIGSSVVITHVANERVFFIRPLNSNVEFQQLMNDVHNYSLEAPRIIEAPEIQDIVLAPLNGRYCRAQVIDTFVPDSDGNSLLVFFLEHGCTEKFHIGRLRKLNYKLRARERQTFKVALKDVKISHNSEAQNYLKKLLMDGEELEVLQLDLYENVGSVVLKVKRSSEIVNTKILETIVNMQQPFNERILFEESKIPKIPTGFNIKLRIMDLTRLSDGFISCMDSERYMDFWNKDREINQYGNMIASDEAYQPIVNEICLVKNEDRWERGSVVELNDDIKMLLIDRFIEKNIPKEDIRQLPQILASDFFTQLCKVGGCYENEACDQVQVRSIVDLESVDYDENMKRFVLFFKPKS